MEVDSPLIPRPITASDDGTFWNQLEQTGIPSTVDFSG